MMIFGACYPKNGQKWILRSQIITSSALSAWTEHSGKLELCFILELLRFSCHFLLFWLSVKESSHSRDTDPTLGDDSHLESAAWLRHQGVSG